MRRPTPPPPAPPPTFGFLLTPGAPPVLNLSDQPLATFQTPSAQASLAFVHGSADLIMSAVAQMDARNVPRSDVLILVADPHDERAGKKLIRKIAFWSSTVKATEADLKKGFTAFVAPLRLQFARKLFEGQPGALAAMDRELPPGKCRVIGATGGELLKMFLPVTAPPTAVGDA